MADTLELNKDRADAKKYFDLLKSKIGAFNDNERILFIHIGNFDVLNSFIKSNPNCNYFIIDQFLNGPWFEMNWDCKFIGTNEDDSIIKALETLNMKFDKIIMNPPYGNIAIDILEKVSSKVSKNGLISLQPIDRWQKAKISSKEPPVKDTYVCERILCDEASKIFQTNQRAELGIITNNKSLETNIIDNEKLIEKIKIKLYEAIKIAGFFQKKLEKTFKEFPVAFGVGGTVAGHGGHGKSCYRITGKFERATQREERGNTKYYNVKNAVEQKSVWKFYMNPMIRFIIKEFGFGRQPYYILPDIKGFLDENGKSPLDYDWTFEDLLHYFNCDCNDLKIIEKSLHDYLWDDEQKLIEETIEKFK